MGRLAARADEGLERVSTESQNRDAPIGASRFFYTVQALHTGRTYLKNRAQSW